MTGRGTRKRGPEISVDELDDENQRISKLAKQQTSHKHVGHKQRQTRFFNNRFISLEETEAPGSSEDTQATEEWFPPIIVTHELKNPKSFHEKVKQWGYKVNFRYVNNRHQILTYLKDDYENVKMKLTELNFNYITFTPKSQKPKLVVMKGMSDGYTESDILDDLKSQSDSVINVTQMKSRRENKLTPLKMYLITLDPSASVKTFAKAVRYCCQHKITFENYVKPRTMRGVQCFNCQEYGHVSRNCGQPFRCVKCDQNHGKDECSKPTEAAPVCVNCKGSHTASYRGCPAAELYLQRFKSKKPTYSSVLKKNTNNVQNQNNVNMKYSGKSITSKPTNSTSQGNTPKIPNIFNAFQNEVKNLFGMDLAQVMIKLKEFWPNYLKINDQSEKLAAMLEFLASFVSTSP